MKEYIIFDTETCPNERAAEFVEKPKCPATYTKKDSIDKWHKEEYPALYEKALSEAALSPLAGQVLVVGVLEPGINEPLYFEGAEVEVLKETWRYWLRKHNVNTGQQWVGFNTNSFDVPYLVRRSWINGLRYGVDMPRLYNDRGYLHESFIDLRKEWGFGDKFVKGKLDELCKAFGIPGKKEGITGGDFAALYKKDRTSGLEYLHADLLAVKGLAERML